MHLSPILAEPPEDPTRFVPLVIVLALAFVIPLILSKFRQIPVVVGEIVFGVLVGPSLLGWVTEGPILGFMSDIGLAFLMFLAGMEIELDKLLGGRTQKQKSGPNILVLALSIYAFTLLLSFGGAVLADRIGISGDIWLVTFVLSATSLGVLLPILKEKDLISAPFGQIVFLTAMLADFVTVILLTVHLIVLDKGFDLEIFSLGLLFILFLMFYRYGPKIFRIPAVGNLLDRLSSATVQIKVRGSVALLMVFVALAEFVDAELILGAFLAGMIISLIRSPEDTALVHNLEAFGFGFFVPVFFVMVGVGLDIQTIFSNPSLLIALPGFFVMALVIKVVPMVLAKPHFSWRDLLAGGFLLNTHLSLEVAVAVIGLRIGLFDQATSAILIVFSVITVLVMPLLFGWLAPSSPKKERPYKLILGATELGITVAQQLRAHNDEVQFIPCSPSEVEVLAETKISTLPFTVDEIEMLDTASVESVLILHEDDSKNLELARKVRSLGIETVIAQVIDPQHLPAFDEEGVKTFSPALERATMISMMARNPDALALLTTTTDERDAIELVVKNSHLAGKQIRELNIPGDLLILAIRRQNDLIIPRGSLVFEMGDKVTLLGGVEDIREIRKLFSG